MALQVTGSFQLSNGSWAVNPQIYLEPTLPYSRILNLNAKVAISTGTQSMFNSLNNGYHIVDEIRFNNIDSSTLTSNLTNPYDALIDALENYLISQFATLQPTCTFTKI